MSSTDEFTILITRQAHIDGGATDLTPLSVSAAFPCRANETLVVAARRASIQLATYCEQGACGRCSAELIFGKGESTRDIPAQKEQPAIGDTVRTCSLIPKSNMALSPKLPWRLA